MTNKQKDKHSDHATSVHLCSACMQCGLISNNQKNIMCSVSIFENFQRNKQNAEIYFKYQCLQYISDFGNDKLIIAGI